MICTSNGTATVYVLANDGLNGGPRHTVLGPIFP